MTVLYTARLRSSQLAPQPFNLLRRAMLVAYSLTEVRKRVHDLGEIAGEMHAGLVVVRQRGQTCPPPPPPLLRSLAALALLWLYSGFTPALLWLYSGFTLALLRLL